VRPWSVPEIHHDAVCAQSDSGARFDQIVEWLAQEHGIKTSKATIGRIVRARRKEREQITRNVVVAKVMPVVCGDLDRLGEIRQSLADLYGEAIAKNKFELAVKIAEQERRVIETRLTLAGASREGGSDDEGGDTIATITARLIAPRPDPIGGDAEPDE
jgi:hypothetical protein